MNVVQYHNFLFYTELKLFTFIKKSIEGYSCSEIGSRGVYMQFLVVFAYFSAVGLFKLGH